MLIAIFAQVHLFALSGLLVIIKCYTIYSSVCVHLFVSTHLRFFVFFTESPHFTLARRCINRLFPLSVMQDG